MVWTATRLNSRTVLRGLCAGAAIGTAGLWYALENATRASDFVVHPYPVPWSHNHQWQALDMRSVRRGYEVYKQVCAACHSLQFIRFRHFIGNFMSEEDAKKEAADALIDDINDKGEPMQRPALLNDFLPKPYKNKRAAAAANNGAAPPDLSLICMAREEGDDYIYHLLTGYGFDPPAGIDVDEGKAYNPYFPNGGVLAMPQQLFDEGIEYSDGTPATMSQQAKDVVTFLRWCAEPWHDTRKRWFWKILAVTPILTFVLLYWKRHTFSLLKSQKLIYRTKPGREWTPDSWMPKPKDDSKTKRIY